MLRTGSESELLMQSQSLTREVNLVIESSVHSEAEMGESVMKFPSLVVWGKNWTCKCQSQPMGLEITENDDSWYACLGEQGHVWIYWPYLFRPAFVKHYMTTVFPPLFQKFPHMLL